MKVPILDGLWRRTLWSSVQYLLLGSVRFAQVLMRRSPFTPAVICLRHRINAKEGYYEPAFSSGKDVLYVSIMSNSSLRDSMKKLLHTARVTQTHIRVLTWFPSDDCTIEAFRKHLRENDDVPHKTVQQVRDAAEMWDILKTQYPENLQVKKYKSSPTMQGVIVKDQWAIVELIPFDTQTQERPALILTPKGDRRLFDLFSDQFEKLWKTATE